MKQDTLYQHNMLASLVPGLLEGSLTLTELLAHGDTGIGTGVGLDGELIILDGVAYQALSTGEIKQLAGDFQVPFANSHFADFQKLFTVNDSTPKEALETKILQQRKWSNLFFAVKMTGTFAKMKTRAVQASTPPFKTLRETADDQAIFTAGNVAGTLIGYYAPALFNGIAVGGFHVHFISADKKTIAGHVLNYELATGEVLVQPFANLEQHFPVVDDQYLQHDFDNDNIVDDLEHAEK